MLDLTVYGIPGIFTLRVPRKPATPPAPAPVFTVQPDAISFYQQGGKLEVLNAAASNTTSWQWQKQNSDSTWSDVTTQKAASFSKTAGVAGDNGTYRLKATGAGGSVTSNAVLVYDVYGYVQNDYKPTGDATSVIPVDHFNYTEDGPAGARQYSCFMRFAVSQTGPDGTSIPAETALTTAQVQSLGLTSGRLVAAWASNNTAVVASTVVGSTGSLVPTGGVKTGTADLTVSWKNIKSTVHVVIP